MKRKPECKIICNKKDIANEYIMKSVLESLSKKEYLHLYDDYLVKAYQKKNCDCEEVLRWSLEYVDLCFVYMNVYQDCDYEWE